MLHAFGNTPVLKKMARPLPFFVGLGVLVFGGGILAWTLLRPRAWEMVESEDVTPIVELGAGALLTLVGTAILFASYMEACSICRDALEDTHATLPLELQAQVRTAVQAARTGDLDRVMLLQGAPLAPPRALRTASLELTFCPTCRQVGRLSSAQRKHRRNGTTATCDAASSVVLSGQALSLALEVIATRNMARVRATYANEA